ncbi:type IV pilus secretin PilQ [Zooshikella marina]|uniref:type IV pilus secretin family protein n=1 Tax=Zooshikella ganghwensis TaxID=202772 RepID=UPI001BB021C6|nr:type IV pilus secretin family protein [Zooshikella ganghwensis]MBU2708518.1 type IV pilus secretin PilQ [Zooshikella ganghwensis]
MNTIRLKKAGLAIATVLAFNSWQVLASVITDLDVASLPGEKVELKLQFDGAVPTPKGYTVERPARISIDLPGTQSALAKKFNEIGFGNTKSITVLETKDKTRLVVNLNQPAKYATRIDGNNLYILIGTDGQDLAAAQQTSRSASQATYTQTPPAVSNKQARKKLYNRNVKAISSIDFERGTEGEGNVIIQLSNPNVSLDMDEQGGRIRLEFPETKIPTNLRNRLDVVDFATPVHYIDATVERGNAVITIEPEGEYDYLAYQTDNTLTISVKSLTAKEIEQLKQNRALYTGEKLSLNFQNIDVRSVLQLIADFTDLNLVASDTVGGDITLRLQNVPWDQALDLVLKAKGLDKRQVGNVLMVAPAEEIAAREKQELENSKQIEELAPTFTELIQIKYADAIEIAALIKFSGTSKDGASGIRLLSERGTIQVVNRTNSILVHDTQAKLDSIRDLLTKIDIPVKQVMIEARIVTADIDVSSDLGIEWSGGKIKKGGKWRLGGSGDDNTTGSTTPGNASLVNLPLSPATSTFSIGFVSNSAILNLELSAIESENKGELISQPKVLTQDKQTARIETGQEVPYQEASSSGATSTSFKKAVLSLEVTPQITADGHVSLKVAVTKDAVAETEFNGAPAIDTNEVNTTVLVPDGETLVLGGVFEETNRQVNSKVPFLGDLPAIGRLFRRTTDNNKKEELLIFITPKIVDNALTQR